MVRFVAPASRRLLLVSIPFATAQAPKTRVIRSFPSCHPEPCAQSAQGEGPASVSLFALLFFVVILKSVAMRDLLFAVDVVFSGAPSLRFVQGWVSADFSLAISRTARAS
jgi:hypothetical protein